MHEDFDHLDVYAWFMLRIAVIKESNLELSNLSPYQKLLEQPAGEIEYQQVEKWITKD